MTRTTSITYRVSGDALHVAQLMRAQRACDSIIYGNLTRQPHEHWAGRRRNRALAGTSLASRVHPLDDQTQQDMPSLPD